jgi:sarcosine oxidase subunit beta
MTPTADVVIIGGGCMGTSVAWHLAARGITRVILVERAQVLGAGSTGRNAGGVRHQFSHKANILLSIESIAAFERFRDEVGADIDFHQDGYLFLLTNPADVRTFERHVALQRQLGVAVDVLDATEAARLAPGLLVDDVVGATFCARDGIADPNGVTMGFAKAAQSRGATIWRETEVVGIEVERGRITGVATTRGPIATATVVNAAGPWAAQIGAMANLPVPVAPYRRHIFIAAPPPPGTWERAGPGSAPGAPRSRIMVIDFATTFYFHREGANLLFGMGDPDEPPGFDTTVNWEFLDRVAKVAVRRLPVLGDASVSHAWAGLYEMTPDAMPIIGRAGAVEGLFLITGFSGHGFQHSPAAGRILADLIAGRDPQFDLDPFDHQRFALSATIGETNVV